MGIRKRVYRFVAARQAHAREQERSETGVRLYGCDACDTTYIAEAMDTCPQCDSAVERTPSERELGFS